MVALQQCARRRDRCVECSTLCADIAALPVNEDGEDSQRRHLIADRQGFQADGVPA